MATIRQQPNGRWQAIVRRKGWPTESETFAKKADADVWARQIENQIDRGLFVPREEAERTSVHEALERYAREVTPKKKGASVEMYRIRKWQENKLAQRSLASLRGADLAKWRDQQIDAGYAHATVRLELALISAMYQHARTEWGIAVENPARAIKAPTVNNARERRLTPIEEKFLFIALSDNSADERSNIWMAPLVRLAIETATRQRELVELDWKDVNLTSKVAIVRDTKNKEKIRQIPLSPTAVRALSDMPRNLSGKVFGCSQSAVKQSWRRAVKRARKLYEEDCKANGTACDNSVLVDIHYHDLRHEGTSRLADKLQVHELAKVTGHKDMRMLLRYYHPKAEDLAKKLG